MLCDYLSIINVITREFLHELFSLNLFGFKVVIKYDNFFQIKSFMFDRTNKDFLLFIIRNEFQEVSMC